MAATRLAKRCAELGIETYRQLPWMPLRELLEREIPSADLCLGGPFGDTPQARRVVTTKTMQCLALGKVTVVGAVDDAFGFVDRENCLLVPQNDPVALATAMRWAFEHRTLLPTIGNNGKLLYRDRFGQTAIAAGLQAALNAIPQGARASRR